MRKTNRLPKQIDTVTCHIKNNLSSTNLSRQSRIQVLVPIIPFQNMFVRERVKSHSVLRLTFPSLHLSFRIRWTVNSNRCWILLLIDRFSCVYLNIHSSPTFHPPAALNCVHSGKCQLFHEFCLWQLPLLKFVQGGLFAFPDGLFTSKSWCAFDTSVIATLSVAKHPVMTTQNGTASLFYATGVLLGCVSMWYFWSVFDAHAFSRWCPILSSTLRCRCS